MRKSTRRKRYYLPVNPIAYAIEGAAITSRSSLDQIRMKELSALEAIIKGQGTTADWKQLVDLMNIAEVMGKSGIGPEVLEVCQRVQQALLKCAKHYEKTRRMVLDGPGIQAIRELIEYADLQQTSISRSEFEKMIQKTVRHINQAKDVYEL